MIVKNCSQKITDLVGYNRKIIQDENFLSFSLDSLILANFVTINSRVKKVLDLGTGIGPIPLILSLRTNAHIDAVEIQKEVSLIAEENMKLNNIQNQVTIYNDDMKNFSKNVDTEIYDVILSNPPFFNDSYSKLPISNSKKNSRHEKLISIEDIFSISRKLLKNNGRLAMIFRTERLVEIVSLFRKYNIEPKVIRFIHHKENMESKLFFIEGMKNGKNGLKIYPPFIMYDDNGKETDEYKRLLSEVM